MKTRHDWRASDALSDTEIRTAALADPDALPLTDAGRGPSSDCLVCAACGAHWDFRRKNSHCAITFLLEP